LERRKKSLKGKSIRVIRTEDSGRVSSTQNLREGKKGRTKEERTGGLCTQLLIPQL